VGRSGAKSLHRRHQYAIEGHLQLAGHRLSEGGSVGIEWRQSPTRRAPYVDWSNLQHAGHSLSGRRIGGRSGAKACNRRHRT